MNLKEFFKKYKNQSKKGFTLVELIATICVISITSTAIISVFLMVRDTIDNTGDVTANQYTSGQIEKFIRNEFQVASTVESYPVDSTTFSPVLPSGQSLKKNDEWMVYDKDAKRLYFKKAIDDAGNVRTVLTINDVWEVHVEIKPLNQVTSVEGSKLKMIYEIKTESGDFTYKGGIVLGNSSYKQPDLDLNGTIDFIWGQDPSCQNDMLIKFHSEVPYEPSTASTSSTSSTP